MSTSPLERAWRLDDRVALRLERFGGLAYDYGTRRLLFLKSRELLELVGRLERHRTARDACRAVGIPESQLPEYEGALARLAATGIIRERPAA